MSYGNMMVFAGNSNPQLANEIARRLNLPLGNAIVGQFSDGEVMVEVMENVRGKDVFIVQPTCAPTNKNLMEGNSAVKNIITHVLYRASL